MSDVRNGGILVCLVLIISLSGLSYSQEYPAAQKPTVEFGIYDRTGDKIPSDLYFYDEFGNKVKFANLINKPTILSLTYYKCTKLCDRITANLAGLIGKLQHAAGKDYSVITVSFDERNTPADASARKKDYIKLIGKNLPVNSWRFLTGDRENILRLTNAVGFKFQRDEDGFKHPATLIVLSSNGKIIRYLYGTTYLQSDVEMALSEASVERTGATIPKALEFCYRYDPVSRKYVFSIFRIVGAGVILFASVFFLFLVRGKR